VLVEGSFLGEVVGTEAGLRVRAEQPTLVAAGGKDMFAAGLRRERLNSWFGHGAVKFLSEVTFWIERRKRIQGRGDPYPGCFAYKCSEAIENTGVIIFGGDELAQVIEKAGISG